MWYAAAWFVAQWKGAETTTMYRDQALEGLDKMLNEFEYVDDDTEFRGDEYEPDLVLPPPGYEDFDRR